MFEKTKKTVRELINELDEFVYNPNFHKEIVGIAREQKITSLLEAVKIEMGMSF